MIRDFPKKIYLIQWRDCTKKGRKKRDATGFKPHGPRGRFWAEILGWLFGDFSICGPWDLGSLRIFTPPTPQNPCAQETLFPPQKGLGNSPRENRHPNSDDHQRRNLKPQDVEKKMVVFVVKSVKQHLTRLKPSVPVSDCDVRLWNRNWNWTKVFRATDAANHIWSSMQQMQTCEWKPVLQLLQWSCQGQGSVFCETQWWKRIEKQISNCLCTKCTGSIIHQMTMLPAARYTFGTHLETHQSHQRLTNCERYATKYSGYTCFPLKQTMEDSPTNEW